MKIVVETISVCISKIVFDSPNGKVHFAQFPGCWIALLSINRNVANLTPTLFQKPLTLYKHPATTATWIVNSAFVWLYHLNKKFYYRSRCIEFTAAFSFGTGKSADEILINSAQYIFGFSL